MLVILVTVLTVDFAVNSVMFETARSFAVGNEEAARMAEHLVVARRIVAAAPLAERAEAARRLSTRHFAIGWRAEREKEEYSSSLPALRGQMIAAEGELARADLRLRLVPIARGGGVAGSALLPDRSVIWFRASDTAVWSFSAGLLLRLALPSLLLLVLAGWLVRSSFAPFQRLVRATRQVGTDDMVLLPETGQSEVRELIRAFNGMHVRIHQLLTNRTQTLLAVGHDLRTPLARLQLRLDGARIDETTREEMAADIDEMAGLLASLQAYIEAGREQGPAEAIDLAAMIRAQIDDAADLGFDAVYDGPDSLEMRAHAPGIRRVIANLVQNALRYAGNAEVGLAREPRGIVLTVADRGPGIPADRLEDVVEPFTRLDEARERNSQGMGLGLAIVERVVQAEGGQLTLANRDGGGLIATIVLPAERLLVSARQ